MTNFIKVYTMANISPKLFQKAIQTGLKTALFTTSAAAIMLGSTGVLGAATIDANATFSTGAGLTPAVKFAGGTLQYTNNGFTVDADEAVNITAIDVNGKAPALFTVNEDISLGSVNINGGAAFPVSVSNGFTLTLTGTDGLGQGADIYDGLGNITLNGATAGLTITSGSPAKITLAGTINGDADDHGEVTVNTETEFTNDVGVTNRLSLMTFNAPATLNNVQTKNFVINNVAANVTVANALAIVGGKLNFAADGQLTLGNGIIGSITAAGDGVNGTVIVTDGNIGNVGVNGNSIKQLTFNNPGGGNAGNIFATNVTVNNAGANVAVAGTVNGTITFAQAGQLSATGLVTGTAVLTTDGTLTLGNGITGDITSAGNNGTVIVTQGDVANVGLGGSSVKQLTFNNTAASNAGNIFATDITVNSATANVAVGTVNGAIDFAAAGKLKANGLVTGTALFTADGTLTLGNGITGAVTSVGNNGTLIVDAGNIAGAIGTNGGANILKQVTFNGASNVTSIDATTVTINNGAAVTAAGAITAAVNFAADAALTANNGIDGAVTAANGNGTLTVQQAVTGAVGTNGASLKVLNAKVDDLDNLAFNSDIYAQTVNFDDVAGGGAVGTIQVGGNLIATNVNFSANAAGGILEFNGANPGEYDFKGTIANGNKATLNVNTTALTTFDPSIGTVQTINIKAGQKALIIDAGSGDVTLLAAAGQAINFADANSSLAFSNESNIGNGAAGTVKLAADLLSSGVNQNRLAFFGGDDITEILNVTNNGAAVINVGNGGNTFSKLSVTGFVATQNLNLAGVAELDVLAGANFIDKNNTAANIATINIGGADADLNVAAAGAATYTIDANAGNVNVPGGNIKFAHKDAQLVLQNSSNANDRTITLGANINPNAPDEGIVVLNSVTAGKKLTIAGGVTLGGPNKLQAIVFQGAGDFDTTGIIFNTTDIGLNTAGATKLGATPANVTLLNDAVQLTQTGNIGGFLDFNGKNGTVTLNDKVNITGAVQNTGGNNNGTLIALGASNLGSVNGIAMLKVGAGAVTIGGAGGEIKIGEIRGNGTALLTLPANFKLTGAINSGGGDPLKLSFSGNSSVSGVVGTAANPVGGITTSGTTSFASSVNANGATTLGGTTSFADTFTNTGAVTLAKDSINNFAKDVTATSFAADGATINFGNSLAFNSAITGSGTTLTLGANQITYPGTGSFTDTLILNTTFDGSTNAGGNILIKSGSTLDLSGVSTLNLVVTATNFDINNISPDTKYTVISAETAGGLKPTPAGNVKITVNNDNRFVDFTFDASTLTLFAEDASEEVIKKEFTGVTQTSLELMANATNGSDARQALNNLGSLENPQIVEAVSHLIQDVVKPSEVVAACSQAISGNILGNLTSINTRISTAQAAAVAAGDEDMNAQFGGWINPFIGNATQKKIQNISGYKSDTTGGTLGFDALINDDAVLGLAYTRAETDVKLKDAKSGDKNKVRSNIFSVYGLYNLPYNNFFVEGVASYGDSKVTSKSRRIVAVAQNTIGYQTASGKYKSENYTGQLMAGYNYALPETVSAMPSVVTPMAGVRYSDIKDKGYKETGTTYQNLLVKGKNYNTFDGLLGAKLSSNITVSEVALTPELYAMVDYAFKNKAPAIDARLQGMAAPFSTNSFKPKKTSFDVGVGVTAKHKMMEYGINYDTNIGSKYFAQQGSVKVRVNF